MARLVEMPRSNFHVRPRLAHFIGGTGIARPAAEAHLAENEDDDLMVVPLPASESQAEHDRIRKSNDRDQDLEREGKPSRHNQGYDEAADGVVKTPEVERVVDE
jgi:hypothetical protein